MNCYMKALLAVILTIYGFERSGSRLAKAYTFEQLTGDDIRYRSGQRNAKKSADQWPKAEVPYVFTALPAERITVIKQAIEAYKKHTCIRFIPKTTSHSDYVNFMDGGDGSCYSYIGRQGGSQEVSIGDGCHHHIGIVLHEMAHALGFLHEHNRPDRDDYVKVRFDRIEEYRQGNFKKNAQSEVELHGQRYDYLSMLHYGKRYFSTSGGDTIVTTDQKFQEKIGQRKNFSVCDLEKINRHYGCKSYYNPSRPCDKNSAAVITQIQTTKLHVTTPPPKPCSDDLALCKQIKNYPKGCSDLPPGFFVWCKKSCDNCDGKKCFDSQTRYSKFCKQEQHFKTPCNESTGLGKALIMFCPLKCGVCKKL